MAWTRHFRGWLCFAVAWLAFAGLSALVGWPPISFWRDFVFSVVIVFASIVDDVWNERNYAQP